MTEMEKMQLQMLYDANDPDLTEKRKAAKDLCFDYNSLRPSDVERQYRIMQKLLGKTKQHYEMRAPFWCNYGFNIEIGENFFCNHNTVIIDCGKVIFGDNVMIGPHCSFSTGGHPTDYERRNKGLEYAYPIIIGNNVWFGAGVHVMPGITIGSNVVIGAGSIVVKDIPDDSLAVGNPCKVIRKITDEDRKRSWDRQNFCL